MGHIRTSPLDSSTMVSGRPRLHYDFPKQCHTVVCVVPSTWTVQALDFSHVAPDRARDKLAVKGGGACLCAGRPKDIYKALSHSRSNGGKLHVVRKYSNQRGKTIQTTLAEAKPGMQSGYPMVLCTGKRRPHFSGFFCLFLVSGPADYPWTIRWSPVDVLWMTYMCPVNNSWSICGQSVDPLGAPPACVVTCNSQGYRTMHQNSFRRTF